MKLTQAQIDRLIVSGGLPLQTQAYRRLPESRWLIPVGILLVSIAVLIVLGLWGIQ